MIEYKLLLKKLENLLDIADENGVIKIMSGNENNKIVSIVALTHGNEISGILVLDYLINEYNIKSKIMQGSINLILGNYKAFYHKTGDERLTKRYIDKDFNRVWGENSDSYENKRKLEIKKYIDESYALIDIHSTSLPSDSMIIPASNNLETKNIIEGFKSDYVLKNIMQKLNGLSLTMYHANLNNRNISIAIEGGQHFNNNTLENIKYNTLCFLSELCIINNFKKTNIKQPKVLDIYNVHYTKSFDIEYIYSKSPRSFDLLKRGQLIAKVGESEIGVDEDSYIIMPIKKANYIGEEIWYLGREEK